MPETIRYAAIFQRLKAYILDCLILFVGLIIWQTGLYFVNPIVKIIESGQQPSGWQVQLWVFCTATLPFLLYFSLMQASTKKATFGMRFVGLEVTDLKGNRINFGRASLRSIFLLLPFELNHSVIFHLMPRDAPPTFITFVGFAFVWIVIFAYLLSIKFTARKQSVHDLIAGTIVVSKE